MKTREELAAEIYHALGALMGEDCHWDYLGPEEQEEQLQILDIYAARIAANNASNHRTETTMTDFPRRNDFLRMTPAERAIRNAVTAVEAVGAHPLLTDAVVLLEQARNKLADFVDQPKD